MEDFLIQHALKHVWCSPEQDRQFLYEPARLSRPIGVKKYVKIEWEHYGLPDRQNEYHVFQIGQIAPLYFNLLPQEETWYSAQDAMRDREILIDIYDDQGRQYPRFACFFKRTNTRNLIVAVRDLKVIGDLGRRPVFIRFYSNAYYSSQRKVGEGNRTWCDGTISYSKQDSVNLLNRLRTAKNKREGECYVFHNGWYVNNIFPNEINPGDTIEFVQDTSIKEVVDIPIKELKSFLSTMDRTRKYLVGRFDQLGETIDFQDDVDFFVYRGNGNAKQGVFYHRPTERSVRMVTHRDYSLPVESVKNTIERVRSWSEENVDTCTLRLHIRRSGYFRTLVHEHHRIKDLYRLSADRIGQAMIGANANVDEWQAASLESSYYPAIMRAVDGRIELEDVKLAYGYNAISQIVGRVLDIPVANGQNLITQPALIFRDNPATFYEYDLQGRVISSHVQFQTGYYTTRSQICGFVENFYGIGGKRIATAYDQAQVSVANSRSYDAFYCPRLGTEPSLEWVLAEKGEDYVFENGVVKWNLDTEEYFVAVRDNTHFLSNCYKVSLDKGLLEVDICGLEDYNGQRKEAVVKLPFAKVDVFLNGHPLIENLDYFLSWPKIVVCNKRFIDSTKTEQDILVRGYGVPDENGKVESAKDYGFIKHGLLSLNNRFDIRDDKNVRCVIAGSLVDPTKLGFAEDHSGLIADYPNGTPYVIDEVILPIDDLPNTNMREFRRRSQEVDRRVRNYLTHYFPEPEFDRQLIVNSPYYVFSPFLFRVYNLLKSDFIDPELYKGQYSNQDIQDWLQPYEWILDYDPIARDLNLEFVDAHPHPYAEPVELDIYRYNFLRRTAELYFRDDIVFTTQVKVKEGWL